MAGDSMTMKLIFRPKFQAYGIDGRPLSGGRVYVYEAGSSTPKMTFSDPDLTVPNPWPLVLDSLGLADLWPGPGTFKVAVCDSGGVQIYTQDNMRLDGDIISFVMGSTSIQVNGGGYAGGYGGL